MDYTNETQAQKDVRMKWFREAKFGMFIHWGIYSVPGGEYKNDKGYGEWLLEQSKMPVSEYAKYAQQFDPEKFNAKAWVKVAKDAGIKYIVITSKHHDGFGMYRSKLTDWCIKSTPFKRDPLKELAAACKDAGIRFCLYHSIMDWHSPLYTPRRAYNDTATGTPDMNEYQRYLHGQLKELLTNYGPLGLVWFDGGWEDSWVNHKEYSKNLYNVCRNLQPNIIVNDRVANGYGDYGTPEQTIPGVMSPNPWESCMTMNDHWGFNKNDQNWKSSTQLVRNLIDCNSKGGNYLLNVGPTPEGEIPQPSIERLEKMGKWLSINKDAIFGTTAGPFRNIPWGRCTQKEVKGSTILYLHVFDWPANGKLVLPGLKSPIERAYLLTDPARKSIASEPSPAGAFLHLPAKGTNESSTTVVAILKGKPEFQDEVINQAPDGTFVIDATDARTHGDTIKIENKDKRDNIGYWLNDNEYAEWFLRADKPGNFAVMAEIASTDDSECEFVIGGKSFKVAVGKTGSYDTFETRKIGVITISGPGKQSLQVKPVKSTWRPINLRTITLKPE